MSRSTVEVATDPPYPVVVGPGVLDGVSRAISGRSAALVADRAVASLHLSRLGAVSDLPRFECEGGEGAKSLDVLGEVLEFMAAAGLSRSSVLVTLGGGTLGDLGGLAASLFKRGCGVIHAPTTLLAQVDASVGGKTAINLDAGKNLAGTFHQPEAVFADAEVLSTLPDREFESGLGEVVKTALIAGEAELGHLEAESERLRAREAGAVSEAVRLCVSTKARIVAEDPLEAGPRRALNLGHTFAHGIEHAAGYGAVPHGIAVAVGLVLAARAAERADLAGAPGLPERIETLLGRLGLPSDLASLRESCGVTLAPEAILEGLAQDKKGSVGQPEFVLPRAVGDLELFARLGSDQIMDLLRG